MWLVSPSPSPPVPSSPLASPTHTPDSPLSIRHTSPHPIPYPTREGRSWGSWMEFTTLNSFPDWSPLISHHYRPSIAVLGSLAPSYPDLHHFQPLCPTHTLPSKFQSHSCSFWHVWKDESFVCFHVILTYLFSAEVIRPMKTQISPQLHPFLAFVDQNTEHWVRLGRVGSSFSIITGLYWVGSNVNL